MRIMSLGNWSIRGKFALLGAIGAILFIVPLVPYLMHAQDGINAAELERMGAEPVNALTRVIQLTQQHRGLSSALLGGAAGVKDTYQAKQDEADQAFAKAGRTLKDTLATGSMAAAWNEALGGWASLKADLAAERISGKDSFARHTALVAGMLEVLDRVIDHHGLSLDPDADAYHLIMAVMVHMPNLTESLGQVRARGTAHLAAKQASPVEQSAIAAAVQTAKLQYAGMLRALAKAMAVNPGLKAGVEATAKAGGDAALAGFRLIDAEVLRANPPTFAPVDFYQSMTRMIDTQFDLQVKGMAHLQRVLDERVAGLERARNLMLGAIAVLVGLAFGLGLAVTRSITDPLAGAVALAEDIARGNLRSGVAAGRGDELGTLLRALAGMQARLADLVREIQGNAGELSGASAELASTAQQVSAATNSQSEAAASMAAAVEQMTVSFSHIADNAQAASEKTADATRLSQTGGQVVDTAGAEMKEIASGIERSAGLVAALREHSNEISKITDVIKDITGQTNLLALNAAIEAARAGESGRGFAVVADAVRELAERTAVSTAEIAGTVKKIQDSTDEVFKEMSRSVERARTGLGLSEKAGAAITQISASAADAMVAVGEISSSLREQSQASNDIARHVENIAQMAQENGGAVDQARESAQTLQGLSAKLRDSVMRFSV